MSESVGQSGVDRESPTVERTGARVRVGHIVISGRGFPQFYLRRARAIRVPDHEIALEAPQITLGQHETLRDLWTNQRGRPGLVNDLFGKIVRAGVAQIDN